MKIQSIKAKEILNSRGKATVEVSVKTEQGIFTASVPSGVSKGRYEAFEILASKAVENIEKIIAGEFIEKEFSSQKEIDQILIKLDNTKNKAYLGANAILAVSIVCCRALAIANNQELYQYITEIFNFQFSIFKLPRPCFNILEGGRHAHSKLDIQEFMIVPDLGSFEKNLTAGKEVFKALGAILGKEFGKELTMGDEGGFALSINKTTQALDFLIKAISQAGYKNKVEIGLDSAGSEFYKNGLYNFEQKKMNKGQLCEFYQDLLKQYPILFIEDPFAQDDLSAWSMFRRSTSKHLIVGDDLTATNQERMKQAKQKGACNGVIIKPNQIGTVTETIEAVKLAREFGWHIIVSHRAGETQDDFIADLAVGTGAEFIKSGAPSQAERMAKYNRLLQIEAEL